MISGPSSQSSYRPQGLWHLEYRNHIILYSKFLLLKCLQWLRQANCLKVGIQFLKAILRGKTGSSSWINADHTLSLFALAQLWFPIDLLPVSLFRSEALARQEGISFCSSLHLWHIVESWTQCRSSVNVSLAIEWVDGSHLLLLLIQRHSTFGFANLYS